MQNTISKGRTPYIIAMNAVRIPAKMVPLEKEKFVDFKKALFLIYQCHLVLAGEDEKRGPYYVTSRMWSHDEGGFEIWNNTLDIFIGAPRERLERFCDDHGFSHECMVKIICAEYYTISQIDSDAEKVVDLNSNPFEDLM